jgi:hypothetical protein
MSGSDAELRRAQVAAYMNAVSASTAVYRLQAKCCDGQSDGKFARSDTKSLSFICLQVPETIEWE